MSEHEDIIDAEAEEEHGTVAGLVATPPPDALVRPAASVADVEHAFRDYVALCDRLLDADDVQHIGGRSFRKKSAWRKLAVAFGVSCEVRDRTYERDERGAITRAEIVVRATAPNGRYMDGLGACDATERRFSKPSHDIPATAMTRATNRACADLFGMGEVSAEEVGDEQPYTRSPRARDLRPEPDVDAGAMTALIEAVKGLPEAQREEFKARRKAEGIDWPVPKAQMARANAIVASLTDDEPF